MNDKNEYEIRKLTDYCEQVLNLREAKLSPEYFYQSLPLCVIDSVFSLGVNYEGTRRTVMRYCDYYGLQRIREDKDYLPLKDKQESIELFVEKMQSFGVEKFTQEIFDNRQRTSTKSGILKSEAVLKFATVLRKFGVNYFQDIPRIISDERFEREIMNIPGQTTGLSLRYFFMLAGSDEFIKPDRMILRFLEDTLNRCISPGEAQKLVTKAVFNLRPSYPTLTPRLLDNEIWKFRRIKLMDSNGVVMGDASSINAHKEGTQLKTDKLQNTEVTMNTRLYIMGLIETHENRSRPKGRNSLTDAQTKLYEVIEGVARNSRDNIVFRDDIVSAYNRRFGTAPNMLPTDFCYNSVNRGPDFEAKYLVKQERGKFKCVGFDWPAVDKPENIEWEPKGRDVPEGLRGKTFIVGTYHKGIYSWNFHRELAPYL